MIKIFTFLTQLSVIASHYTKGFVGNGYSTKDIEKDLRRKFYQGV